jgi:hypothetical protein
MAKKSGTATKPGGIKSWMNHLFTKSNKTKTNNVGVTTKARSTFDSLSEKNTTGSSSAKDSIVRSSSSTTTTTTTTTQSSSNHHPHSKVPETAHPHTATNHELIPSTENLAVSSVDHDEERAMDGHVDTQEDQQPSADCPAPIEVKFSLPLFFISNADTHPFLKIFWQHGGQDVFVTGTFDNWSSKY